MDEGWLYLEIMPDLFHRDVVDWSLQPGMTVSLVMDAPTVAESNFTSDYIFTEQSEDKRSLFVLNQYHATNVKYFFECVYD
jgi:hypothetical protein